MWRVTHTDGVDSETSDEAEFSVIGGQNSYPVATWPVGNPTVYTNTPTLSWYMEGSTLGWTHYKVGWSKEISNRLGCIYNLRIIDFVIQDSPLCH
ncbi:MAG: hypothetical protein U5K00_00615 [Melioribacteraceae bacterium]|nr:hypothetical protein [Melioribacteraceae bacterium]